MTAVAATACIIATAAKPRFSEAERDARKADYLYLEALGYQQQGKLDAYFSLINEAHLLNPSDKFLGMEDGLRTIYESQNDSTQIEKGLKQIEDYLEANPEDFYNMLSYATLTSRLGRDDRSLDAWSKLYQRNPDRMEVAGMYADALTRTADTTNVLKAIDIYNDIDRTEGVNTTTATRKMQLYYSLGDTLAVKRQMNSLLESSPKSVEFTTLAGSVYMQLGDQDSALVFFNKAVELDPSNGPAVYQRAQYYNAIGDSARYDSEVFQALQLPDLELQGKLAILYEYVRKLYTDSLQQPRIESLFNSLIEQYPHEAAVRNLFGDFYISVNQYAPAAEQISYALDSDPTDADRWKALGSLYYEIKQYDRTLQTVDNALRYFPDVTNFYLMGSAALSQMKEYDRAIEYLDRGLAVTDSLDNEELSNINCSIADILYLQGKNDSAFVFYEKALDYNPDNMLALNNCAYHLACTDRDLERARTMIERVVKDDPESCNSLDTYAWVLFKLKDYAKAREMIDGALANDDSPVHSVELLQHAGDIYFMDGQPEKAVEFWQQALKQKPDDDLLQRKVKHKTFFYK